MKRKFGNLLMVAALVFAVGSFFTSCKDYDEELFAEMYDEVRDAALEDVVAALQNDKSELSDLVNSIIADALKNVEQCECNIAEIQAKIDSLEQELANLPTVHTPVIGVRKDADGIYYWTLDGEWLLDAEGNKIKAVGTDGVGGNDGHTPVIGVRKDADGIYYWTLDGEWLLDAEGNKIKAVGTDGVNGNNGVNGENGITPQFKIEEDYWYVSYDNGASWTKVGKATGEPGQPGEPGEPGKDADYDVVTQMIQDAIAALQEQLQVELAKLAESFATANQLNEVKAVLNTMRLEFVDHVDAFLELRDDVEYVIANLQAVDSNIIERLEALEGMEGVDLSDILDRLDNLENGSNVDLSDVYARLTALEEAEGVDLTDILDRLVALEKLSQKEYYVKGDLDEVIAQAYAADALSKANELRIEALYELLENYNIVDTAAVWAEIKVLQKELVDVRAEAVANLAEAKEYSDSVAGSVKAELEGKLTTTVGQLGDAITAVEKALQSQIDALGSKVVSLESKISALNDRVAELEGLKDRVDNLEKDFQEQITGIVLNGAYSPVVGYFNLPNGTKSNILAAYYGKVSEDFYFPTVDWSDNGIYIDEAAFETLGFADKAIEIKNNKYGVLVAEGANAGKVYMTINPAEVNLEGKKFSFVNSWGENSPAEILNVKASTEKLAFGYTRAGAVALYEAEARIENAGAAKIRMELTDLKDVLVDVIKLNDGINITDLITTLYAKVNNIADANAVKASWTDSKGEAHTVYSDFGLATVAIKPLGYNFLADLNVQSIPGYHNGMNVVNKIFDNVGVINIPDLGLSSLTSKLEGIKFGGAIGDSLKFPVKYSDVVKKDIPFKTSVEVEVELPLKDIEIELEIPIDEKVISTGAMDFNGKEIVVTVPNETVKVKYTIAKDKIAAGSTKTTVLIDEVISVEIPVEFEMTIAIATKDILGELGGSLANIDTLLEEVNAMIAGIEGKVEVVENVLNSALNKVQNGLNEYLGTLNNKVCGLVNSFNGVLQPTMLVSTADGFSMLSSIKGAPTTIDKASAVLVPTSYSAEILAPACQKFVAVTKAWKNGRIDVEAAKAANTGNLATVLPGGTRAIEFSGKSGYTYEIVYQAMDFYGFIANTKYYVTVK